MVTSKKMRVALILLIGVHGIIHLFVFLKTFEVVEFSAISQPISKDYGVFWLLTFLLFSITIILDLVRSNYWWSSGLLATVFSQIFIFNYWSDAKFGTIANVIILLATIIGYSNFNFEHKIKRERKFLFEDSQPKNQEIIDRKSIEGLPPIIQKWLNHSGIIGSQNISNIHLTQKLQLKLKSEQENWSYGKAEQYFTTQPPAFNWNIHTKMNSVLSVVGRDKFENGRGEMTIKLLSLIPVANAKNNEKTNEATLQRYLAEIVWFPSAALSKYIKWENMAEYSARAIMTYKGTKGSGVFHFDANGNFKKFVAMRYKESNDAKPTEWTVTSIKTEERNGIKIPVECTADWELGNGKWTWLKLKITDIRYNVKEMPVANKV